ncbi:MAG: hypothetical protein OFPII_00550 [Osedax symbiont Rs1]|nr:MAG: hypothetical protein OFPII_00550 [Osedax symbiont Rs1]
MRVGGETGSVLIFRSSLVFSGPGSWRSSSCLFQALSIL